MKVIKDKNNVIIRNAEREAEDIIFDKIAIALESNGNISIRDKIMGPSENVIIAECNGDELKLIYDVDYGIDPIECTADNVDAVFDIIQAVLNQD